MWLQLPHGYRLEQGTKICHFQEKDIELRLNLLIMSYLTVCPFLMTYENLNSLNFYGMDSFPKFLKVNKSLLLWQVLTSWQMDNWGKHTMGPAESATNSLFSTCSSHIWLFGWLETWRSHWDSVEKKQRVPLWYVSSLCTCWTNFFLAMQLPDSSIKTIYFIAFFYMMLSVYHGLSPSGSSTVLCELQNHHIYQQHFSFVSYTAKKLCFASSTTRWVTLFFMSV